METFFIGVIVGVLTVLLVVIFEKKISTTTPYSEKNEISHGIVISTIKDGNGEERIYKIRLFDKRPVGHTNDILNIKIINNSDA